MYKYRIQYRHRYGLADVFIEGRTFFDVKAIAEAQFGAENIVTILPA